jgi:hypothetical protein
MAIKELRARSAVPREKPYKLADGEGLCLLVKPNGAKLWRMKYRIAGKEKLLSFGAYPEIGLTAARDLRLEAKHALAMGADPMEELAQSTAKEGKTFKQADRARCNPVPWCNAHRGDFSSRCARPDPADRSTRRARHQPSG